MFTGQVLNWNDVNPVWGEAHVSKSGEVHAWMYAPGEDIQQVFDRSVLEGRSVTSRLGWRLARSKCMTKWTNDEMQSDLIPRHWITTDACLCNRYSGRAGAGGDRGAAGGNSSNSWLVCKNSSPVLEEIEAQCFSLDMRLRYEYNCCKLVCITN